MWMKVYKSTLSGKCLSSNNFSLMVVTFYGAIGTTAVNNWVVVRMSILDTKVDGSIPSINMFSP